MSISNSLELHHCIEQFYYREARLLDDRKNQQWFALVAEDIRYTVPARHTPSLDIKKRQTEAFLNVEQELASGLEPGYRDEGYMELFIRVDRSFKANSWSDNPPARTRRFISNIEIESENENGELVVYSNFMLSYSRHLNDNCTVTGQRKDLLRPIDNSYKIASRRILLESNVVNAPTLGLFF